jgi:predicted Zn finger-like uncharacterized protein
MEVTCPACAARYSADDEKLRGKTARMRCKACNTAWLVTGPAASQAVQSAAPASEDPPTARAAVAKTGNEREKRDLFAVRDPEPGGVKQTLLPPPVVNAGVGARNENSVLFSLDQLGAAARLKTPEPSPAPRLSDEDGVIDLKVLTSAPPAALRPAPLPVVAPLFSEPAPMTLEVGETGRAPKAKRSKLGVFFSLVAATAMLGGLGYGISLAFKSEEPIKHTAAMAVEPPKVEPKVEPPKDPTPPPAVATADEKEKDKDAKETKGKKGKKGKGKGAAAKAAASKPAAAPKAADPCGCKGDFNCVLACTAKNGK